MVMHDIAGEEIRVGDRVACAFRSSTQAHLRVGTVRELLDDERGLVVEWHFGRFLPQGAETKIAYNANKIARL